jgi:acyl-CoA thioester hydrolase
LLKVPSHVSGTPPKAVEASLRVIYGDTDQMGVVYYANYLRYFEFSRSEFFRAKGGSYVEMEKEGFGLPVAEVAVKYRAPARYDDELVVRVRLAELRRASMRFEYEVLRRRDGLLLCTGHTLHACTGRDGRPTALPESVVKLLSA